MVAQDCLSGSPVFESGIAHDDPDAQQDHCAIGLISGYRRRPLTWKKHFTNKYRNFLCSRSGYFLMQKQNLKDDMVLFLLKKATSKMVKRIIVPL